ncbi:MAG: hypothetical protein J1E96_07845 [Ruminococcus sp.]|nr:hypothetical protein [Ruminococcus sp.]
MAKKEETLQQQDAVQGAEEKPICGIIMPISEINGCGVEHWKEVKSILTEAIDSAGYNANLVSEANDSSVIQKRIVRNLYDNEIVVCDVSCKNPNVMFELGLRLAFDKPTIIVMDDNTGYTFDVSIIEHLEYPRDLSYYKILDFKKKLKDKILGTIKESAKADYTTFLKHFGNFTAAKINDKEVPMNEALIPYFNDISKRLDGLAKNQLSVQKIKDMYMDNINDDRNREIDDIVRDGIIYFMKEFGYTRDEIVDSPTNTIKLREFLEENSYLKKLCTNRKRLELAIAENMYKI